VVATAHVLDEGVALDHHARCPMGIEPRIGLSRPYRRPWSHSTRLSSYWPLLWHAAGTNSSITFANAGACSVMTSPGVTVNSQDSGEERARSGDVTAL
jgi:hypothetical protein